MTQKELLYMEDMVCHEESIINLLNDFIANSREDIKEYCKMEINKHQEIKEQLLDVLKEKANG